MLLLAVAGGLVGGPVRRGTGSVSPPGSPSTSSCATPMGLSALVFTLVGYGVGGRVHRRPHPVVVLPVVTASIASAAGVVVYAFAGAMLGEPMVSRRLVTIVGVVGGRQRHPGHPRHPGRHLGHGDDHAPIAEGVAAGPGRSGCERRHHPLADGDRGVVVISLFSALLARLWYLQVLAAPTYKEEAQLNSVRFVYTEAPRGRILDRNGKILVGNRVVPTVTVDKTELGEKPDDVIAHLAALVKVPVPVLKERIDDPR